MNEETATTPEQSNEEILTSQASDVVREAFAIVSEQSKVLARQLRDFNARKQQIQEETSRGARRTSGHIV